MTISRAAKIAVPASLLALVAAGVAAAYFVASSRDVTSASREALALYRQARDNELKLYTREATTLYASALQQDPQFFLAQVRLAGQLLGRDHDRAVSLLATARRSMDDVTPRERLIWQLYDAMARRDREGVGRVSDELVRRYPDDAEGYEAKARILEQSGRLDEAIAQWERLVSKNPNYAGAYNTLGYFWMARGDYGKAEESFKRYRFLAPDQANPCDSLGELYVKTGRLEEAEKSLNQAVAIKPDFFAPHGHLGTLAVARGQWEAAAGHYRHAADLSPDAGSAGEFRIARALSLLYGGNPRAAIDVIDEWQATLRPGATARERAHVLLVRAVVLASAGQLAEAEREVAREDLFPPVSGPEGGGDPKVSKEGLADWDYFASSARAAIALRAGRGGDAEAALARRPWPGSRTLGSDQSYFPGRACFRSFLAESLAAAGRRGEAQGVIGEVLAASPACRPALEARARLTGETVAATVLPAQRAPDVHAAQAR